MATAVIRTGSHQFRVKAGDVISIQQRAGEPGTEVVFDEVLSIEDGTVKVGTPQLKGAQVQGRIIEQGRGPKLIVFKFKRRKKCRRKAGHRQQHTTVEITSIKG